jgi:hypothetical protein
MAGAGAWLVRPRAGAAPPLVSRGFAAPVAPVAPVAPAAVAAGAVRAAPDPSIAVLAAPELAGAVGAVLALGSAGGGVALLASWRTRRAAGPSLPAVPAARRLAGALGERGLAAEASARLVVVRLPDDGVEAVDALRRADAVAGATARVVALGGARGDAWDGVLLSRDEVVLHGADADLVGLAAQRLGELGANVRALPRLPPLALRVLASAGVVLPGTGRALRGASEVAA